MDATTQKKFDEVASLIKQKEEIEERIKNILNPEPRVALPDDFSIKDNVLTIIQDSGSDGISKRKILDEIRLKHPKVKINATQVGSSLAYLKQGKKQITLDKGKYTALNAV